MLTGLKKIVPCVHARALAAGAAGSLSAEVVLKTHLKKGKRNARNAEEGEKKCEKQP